MRSPWRMLTDLVSRRQGETKSALITKDEATAGTGAVSAPLLLAHLEPLSALAEPNPPASEKSIDSAASEHLASTGLRPSAEMSAIDAVTSVDVETVVTGEPYPDPESGLDADVARAADPGSAPVKQRRKPRRVRADSDPGATQIARFDPTALAASSVPRSFSESVAELDGEVHELRVLLAEKLRRQNAQLRQMLERFETS